MEEINLVDTTALEEIIFKREDSAYLRKYLKELKPEYRQVILLIDFNGLSLLETAKVMDKSVSAIKVLSHRARKRLKQILEKGGFSYDV